MVMFVISNPKAKKARLSKSQTKKPKRNVIKMDRKIRVILVKKFAYGKKEIYEGTLRKARTLIPPSKRNQYTIINLETGEIIKG